MNQSPGDDARSEDDSGADAPLHEALDDLENMLGPHGIPSPGSKNERHGVASRAGTESGRSPTLAAGVESGLRAALAPGETAAQGVAEAWDPTLYRLTAQRLASELEIIMNARLEAALALVGEEIRREVQNHIEIVLPEIVSSLAAAETPPRRD